MNIEHNEINPADHITVIAIQERKKFQHQALQILCSNVNKKVNLENNECENWLPQTRIEAIFYQ